MLQTFSQQIFQDIKDRILHGDLKPGEKLILKNIQDTYGVSSTPARDALKMLSRYGFVEMSNHTAAKIVTVNEQTKKELIQLYSHVSGITFQIAMENNPDQVLEKLKENYQSQLNWDHLSLERRAQIHVDFINIFLDYSKNQMLQNLLDSTSGAMVISFGNYEGKFGTEITRQDAKEIIQHIESGHLDEAKSIYIRQMQYLL